MTNELYKKTSSWAIDIIKEAATATAIISGGSIFAVLGFAGNIFAETDSGLLEIKGIILNYVRYTFVTFLSTIILRIIIIFLELEDFSVNKPLLHSCVLLIASIILLINSIWYLHVQTKYFFEIYELYQVVRI